DKFGQSSERGAILEQLELSLADLEEDASAAATAAQMAAAQAKIEVRSFERRKPARRPLPEHLPRERIVYPAPIEREINGMTPQQRLAVRNERSRPLIAELETWLRTQRGKLSRKSETAKAIDYSLKRRLALTRFLADGRLCISNNAAERARRGIAVGRHNWTF